MSDSGPEGQNYSPESHPGDQVAGTARRRNGVRIVALVGLLVLVLVLVSEVLGSRGSGAVEPPAPSSVRPFPDGAVLIDEQTGCDGEGADRTCWRRATIELDLPDVGPALDDAYAGRSILMTVTGDFPRVITILAATCAGESEPGQCE